MLEIVHLLSNDFHLAGSGLDSRFPGYGLLQRERRMAARLLREHDDGADAFRHLLYSFGA
ncbi:hypothetical protein D3C84_915090 [compost metagenome]